MAFTDVDAASDKTVANWLGADLFGPDITACMTDEELNLPCGLEIKSTNALRLVINKNPVGLTSLTVRLQVPVVVVSDTYAMLAYNSSSGVTATNKIVLGISSPGTFDFIASEGFISQLFDQGGGSFAVRIVPDSNGSGQIEKSEADHETVGPLVTFAFSSDADADFGQALSVIRSLVFSLEADADFGQALSALRFAQLTMQADADFGQALSVTRSVALVSQADSDFVLGLTLDKSLAFASQAEADFGLALSVARPIALSAPSDADFVQILSTTRSLSFSSQADADFALLMFTSRLPGDEVFLAPNFDRIFSRPD